MTPSHRHARLRRGAFTLVELLVVIGIIALLIGILLPALNTARESARGVTCRANMRSAAQAMLLYVNESKGWLAGPHTSGRRWNATPNLDNQSYGLDAIGPNEGGDKRRPTQNMDWASPTLGITGILPENDLKRLIAIYSTSLSCPSNSITFNALALDNEGVGATLKPTDFRYMSYSATINFHVWPQYEAEPSRVPKILTGTGTSNKVRYPAAYAPKITKIGDAASKAYLIEGSRHILGSEVSFNMARYQIQGGNFMAVGPWTRYDDLPFLLPGTTTDNQNYNGAPLSEINKRFAWRHRGRMNIAYFDGHVDSVSVADSIKTGLYFPQGSQVLDATLTYDSTDANGHLIN